MGHRKLSRTEDIVRIINECDVCNVAMANDNEPYVIPMNFALEGEYLYLHSDHHGKKTEMLGKNNKVCISFSTGHKVSYVNEEVACSWNMKYKSVIAYGTVDYIDDMDEKARCLNLFMKKYAYGKDDFTFNEPALKNVKIFRILLQEMNGRVLGY